jgi:GH15 family glucan-1,4-alpha-glucosidase
MVQEYRLHTWLKYTTAGYVYIAVYTQIAVHFTLNRIASRLQRLIFTQHKQEETMKNTFLKDLQDFIDYVNDFYNIEYGLYRLFTSEQIENAIGEYLTEPHEIDIQFDSIDREHVRKILQPEYEFFLTTNN